MAVNARFAVGFTDSPSVRRTQLWAVCPASPQSQGPRAMDNHGCVLRMKEKRGPAEQRGARSRRVLQTRAHGPSLCCPSQIHSPGCEAHSWSCPSRDSVGKKRQDGNKNLCGRKVFLCLVPVELLLLVTNTQISPSPVGTVALSALLIPALCHWGLSLRRCAGFWSVPCAAFCLNGLPWLGRRVLWVFNLLLILFLFCPPRNLSASPLMMRSGRRGR